MACLSCLEANSEQKMLLASEETTHYPILQACMTIEIHFYSSIGITYKLLHLENKSHALSPLWFSMSHPSSASELLLVHIAKDIEPNSSLIHSSRAFQVHWFSLRCFGLQTDTSACKFLAIDSRSRASSNHTGLSVPSAQCGIVPAVAWPQHPKHKNPTMDARRWAHVTITEATFSRCLLYYLLRLRFYILL